MQQCSTVIYTSDWNCLQLLQKAIRMPKQISPTQHAGFIRSLPEAKSRPRCKTATRHMSACVRWHEDESKALNRGTVKLPFKIRHSYCETMLEMNGHTEGPEQFCHCLTLAFLIHRASLIGMHHHIIKKKLSICLSSILTIKFQHCFCDHPLKTQILRLLIRHLIVFAPHKSCRLSYLSVNLKHANIRFRTYIWQSSLFLYLVSFIVLTWIKTKVGGGFIMLFHQLL